ncbi:hypothetical protein [Sphingomonas sp. M1-B02]|uniref:hypothetical protein n=1 Tax=Sphingomonas sp. M1-B02 TaxID=3114300 RepID=UPI00223ED021|nr:hypothetical protein [Sphingomonas sp. S6-11]UZK64714.1 hypothetical protein OKW87_09180 [Sphingomonas sp. S6-11]
MGDSTGTWDGQLVRQWLERRLGAARLDQAAADRRGYEAQDDYDKAAAEEWACRALTLGAFADEQDAFAKRLKQLIGEPAYQATGIYDDARFERHVRSHLRKVAKMTKENVGFEKTLRFQ